MKNELITHIVTTVVQNTMLPVTLILRQTIALQEDFWQASNSMCNVHAAILQKDAASIKKSWKQLIAITDQTAKKWWKAVKIYPKKGRTQK